LHLVGDLFELYLKTPTRFDSSVHHRNEVLLFYHSYRPVIMQPVGTYT